jgi:Asp-tRNA(Asn)/Glu-tRNA(Gln) amidotransferase B subunit
MRHLPNQATTPIAQLPCKMPKLMPCINTGNWRHEQIVDEIIKNNAPQVAQFKSGNEKILGFFVGQAMKATQGKANPKLLNELLF